MARAPPAVLSINTLGLDSQSPPSPGSQETVKLTVQELLVQASLPENAKSVKLLQELGFLPKNDTLPAPRSPSSPSPSSPPPYVPPHARRQASSSPPTSSIPHTRYQASSVPPAPISSSTPASSPLTSSPPVSSLGPPFIKLITVTKGCFYCHNKHPSNLPHTHRNHYPWFHHHLAVGTCHLNDYGKLCLGPKRAYVTPLPF